MRMDQWRKRNGDVTPAITTARRIIGAAASLSAIAAVLMLLTPSTARSQSGAHHDWAAERWKAQWIAWPEAPQRDTGIFHFRKKIDVPALPTEFIVHVSADNRFILFVNGARVGEGPASSDLGHWKYETLDLRPFLHSGTNLIAATVWNFGTLAPVAQMTSRAGFVLQGDSPAEEIANTDESWDVEIEQGHQPSPTDFMAVMKTYYAGPPGEIIDGRKYDWNWNKTPSSTTPSASDERPNRWRKAATIGPGAARPSSDTRTVWMLQPDPLPPMEYAEISLGHSVSSIGFASASGAAPTADVSNATPGMTLRVQPNSTASLLLDAGALTTAYPELTISGGADSKIRITYSEALFDDRGEKANRNETQGRHILGVYDEFIADGGRHRVFTPLIWRTWRYLQVDVTTEKEEVSLDKIAAHFSAYPFHELARFTSDDADLAKIWEVSWRTARLCAHETYMDTPYYERLQYVGDTRIQALLSYTVGGDDRLARQAIDTIDNSRIPDGITTSRYPSQLPQIIPTFSLMWVGMVRDFSMYRDDPAFVRAHLGGTRTVLDWFTAHQRPDGLVGKLPWWPFVDWTRDFHDGVPPQDADGGSAPITLQLIEGLRDAADLETRFGEPARATIYSARANKAAEAVLRLCWDEKTGLLADTPAKSHFSQHANALGIWLDVIPASRHKDVMEKILETDADLIASRPPRMSDASYYFRFYLARALEHAGMADVYIATLHPWRKMLQLGLSTWAETPEPTRSDSHAWSAHPNYDLLRLVAGIRPSAPGFAEVVIEPHLGGLKNLTAAMPHPRGKIEMSYVVGTSGTTARITVPDGVPAKFIWHGRTYALRGGEQILQLP
jgi:alpha-L-rhamnosidase